MAVTEKEWYIIINPHAGSGKTMEHWALAERRLADLDIPYVTAYTGYKSHAKHLASQAAAAGYRKILAVGGDGSVHEMFTGVLGWCEQTGTSPEEFYMGVIPIGSGNDWIKSLNVPNDTLEVVDCIYRSSFRKQDVVKVESEDGGVCYMANIGGVGFDSHVCERVNRKKERGKRNERIYVLTLIQTLLTLKKIRVSVVGDGEEYYRGGCYSIAFGNGKYSGGGMRQTSASEIDDGLLDVMIVPVIPLLSILKEAKRLFNGSVHESGRIIYKTCRSLKVIPLDDESQDVFEMDGEIEGRLPLQITMTGKQVNVLVG